MLLKILLRNQLLNLFKKLGMSSNPFSLSPICHYLYNDYLDLWVSEIKSHAKGMNTNEKLEIILRSAINNHSPESLRNLDELSLQNPDKNYTIEDGIDDQIKDIFDRLDDGKHFRHQLYGVLCDYLY
jgi:hypothetical protein